MARRINKPVTTTEARKVAKVRWSKVRDDKIVKVSTQIKKVFDSEKANDLAIMKIATLVVDKKLK